MTAALYVLWIVVLPLLILASYGPGVAAVAFGVAVWVESK